MSAEPVTAAEASPWEARRLRAEALRGRYPFADEVLALYLELLPVADEAWRTARLAPPPPTDLVGWAVATVLPGVVAATGRAGPAALGEAVVERSAGGDPDGVLAAWLAGAELGPVESYLARASLAPALEALRDRAAAACGTVPVPAGAASCPCCGGLPQLSVVADSGDVLVTGRRSLLCARCATSWAFSRSTCPGCGESDENRLLVYAEQWTGAVSRNGDVGDGNPAPVLPNLRIVGCTTCRAYLIEVDLSRDARAVPDVDELAALPLDLYAADAGLQKITPNLMGF